MSTLQSWTEAACAELGLDPATVDERLILNLTGWSRTGWTGPPRR